MKIQRNCGMSLLEVLIVTSIVVLVTLTAVMNYSSFGAATKTSATAENIFTLIKETRQRSLAIKEHGSTGIFPNYGIYFDTATPNQIIIYADCISDDNGDDMLNSGDNFTYSGNIVCPNPDTPSPPTVTVSGLVKTLTLDSPIQVLAIRAPTVSGTARTRLYIEFVRPEPTVWITHTGAGPANVLPYGTAEVDIGDSQGRFVKTIIVGTSGLISLK